MRAERVWKVYSLRFLKNVIILRFDFDFLFVYMAFIMFRFDYWYFKSKDSI